MYILEKQNQTYQKSNKTTQVSSRVASQAKTKSNIQEIKQEKPPLIPLGSPPLQAKKRNPSSSLFSLFKSQILANRKCLKLATLFPLSFQNGQPKFPKLSLTFLTEVTALSSFPPMTNFCFLFFFKKKASPPFYSLCVCFYNQMLA